MHRIPLYRPYLTGSELDYVKEVFANRRLSGDGPFTQKCQTLLEEALGVPKVMLTTSCTHALEIAALLLGIQPGDEAIIPSFTFVSTVNAFVLRGARPVFADIRPDTLNLDEKRLENLITERTKVIVPVHYMGVACEMDAIMEIAQKHKIAVIEDNAHGLFARYKNRSLGAIGCMSALSFHETKNFICGEGGALLLNDPRWIGAAEIIREKGTNRCQFVRGEVDRYTWVALGSSYLPSDLLAACLYAQLQMREKIQERRARMWRFYYENLQEWAESIGAQLPAVPPYCEQAYHQFYFLMPTPEQRRALIAHLKSQDIESAFHYLPLHLSDMGRRYGGREGDCPVTEDICYRLIRIPFYYGLSEAEQSRVVEEIVRFDA
ncbi:MAG: dTDP-4-amino-4,6-dideoxygalactose transaminase [Candidatus Omnitrophota bacterium]